MRCNYRANAVWIKRSGLSRPEPRSQSLGLREANLVPGDTVLRGGEGGKVAPDPSTPATGPSREACRLGGKGVLGDTNGVLVGLQSQHGPSHFEFRGRGGAQAQLGVAPSQVPHDHLTAILLFDPRFGIRASNGYGEDIVIAGCGSLGGHRPIGGLGS